MASSLPPDHRARKRFGQNFLHDPGVIARIVTAIAPKPGQIIVEIGPGLGALTFALLERVDTLNVIELDRDLAARLRADVRHGARFHVHEADALRFDFTAFAATRKLRIVGNLPYNISTPLLFHLFEHIGYVHDMHFMLQKEVVDRMVAAPDTEHYGRLSVMVQLHCVAERLFNVGPGAFTPAPKVESSIVRLTPHAAPPVRVDDPARFAAIVTAAFAQRRKTLRNALRALLDEHQIAAAGVDPGARAEQLDLAAFARLSLQTVR